MNKKTNITVMETETKANTVIPGQIRYLLDNSDYLTIYQIEFVDSLRRQWKRQKSLSKKQLAVLNAIYNDIKEIKFEL